MSLSCANQIQTTTCTRVHNGILKKSSQVVLVSLLMCHTAHRKRYRRFCWWLIVVATIHQVYTLLIVLATRISNTGTIQNIPSTVKVKRCTNLQSVPFPALFPFDTRIAHHIRPWISFSHGANCPNQLHRWQDLLEKLWAQSPFTMLHSSRGMPPCTRTRASTEECTRSTIDVMPSEPLRLDTRACLRLTESRGGRRVVLGMGKMNGYNLPIPQSRSYAVLLQDL